MFCKMYSLKGGGQLTELSGKVLGCPFGWDPASQVSSMLLARATLGLISNSCIIPVPY